MNDEKIVLDIQGKEKSTLTPDSIVEKFRSIKHRAVNNDEMLLQ